MPRTRNVILSVATRILVCLALLGIGFGVFMLLLVTATPPAPADPDELRPRVDVMRIAPVSTRRQIDGFGTAQAYRSANVPAQVRGVVEVLPDDIVAGNLVQRGQLLAQLEDSDYQREVQIRTQQLADLDAQVRRLDVELRATLRRLELIQHEVELAEADLQRVERARETAGATQREVDQQRQLLATRQREAVAFEEQLEQIEPRRDQLVAARNQAESSLGLAERNLERTRIVSPITGVLQFVDIDLGESVQADQVVARVVDLSRIDIPVRLPASARPYVAIGSEVTLTPAANSTMQWHGHVARLSPEDDEAARTMTAYVEFLQDPTNRLNRLLVPGQFVRTIVLSEDVEHRHAVPRRAVVSDRIGLVEDGRVRSRRIEVAYQVREEFPETGLTDDHWLILDEPLPEGALVILDASRRIADGTIVQAITVDQEVDDAAEHARSGGQEPPS